MVFIDWCLVVVVVSSCSNKWVELSVARNVSRAYICRLLNFSCYNDLLTLTACALCMKKSCQQLVMPLLLCYNCDTTTAGPAVNTRVVLPFQK